MERAGGITPEQVAVQFGYFSRTQTVLLVAAPLLLFALGQAMGPLLGRGLLRVIDVVSARVQLGGWRVGGRDRPPGAVPPPETPRRLPPRQDTPQAAPPPFGPPAE